MVKGLALLSEAFVTVIRGMMGRAAKEECVALPLSPKGSQMCTPISPHLPRVQALSSYRHLCLILLLLMVWRDASEVWLWSSLKNCRKVYIWWA